MIVTVTPNPMLDKTLWVSTFAPGVVHRALRLETLVGGKGVNVARALTFLGEDVVASGFVGGHVGEAICAALEREGLQHDFVTITSNTREGFTIIDSRSGQRTAVFEPGHELNEREVDGLIDKVRTLLPRCRALALCGSMPCPGFDNLFGRLIAMARAQSVPVMLDSYGEPLRLGLDASPNFLKPNRDEALQTFRLDARNTNERRALLERLAGSGATHVLVTDGEHPTAVFAAGEFFLAQPPAIRVVSSLGSGDAVVAAFLYGHLHGLPTPDLLRFALAAGAVNARESLPGYANLEQIKSMAAQIELQPMPG